MKPLNDFVDGPRAQKGAGYSVPYVDPATQAHTDRVAISLSEMASSAIAQSDRDFEHRRRRCRSRRANGTYHRGIAGGSR
jgi:hypothetical protein